jgi:hypothetical protein
VAVAATSPSRAVATVVAAPTGAAAARAATVASRVVTRTTAAMVATASKRFQESDHTYDGSSKRYEHYGLNMGHCELPKLAEHLTAYSPVL